MPIHDSSENLFSQIAIAADFCHKPWLHSVVDKSLPIHEDFSESDDFDLIIKIESRNKEGERHPEFDIDAEVYKSGSDLSITLSWSRFPEKPILWHGKHSLWMDSVTGKRCNPPHDGTTLETFARRLRTTFIIEA